MKKLIVAALLINSLTTWSQGIVSTVAGSDSWGNTGDNIQATLASISLDTVFCSAVTDKNGNIIFADSWSNRIRKVGQDGIINTIAGTGTYGSNGDGGAALLARIAYPTAVTIDSSGNIYFCESSNGSANFTYNKIRKISTSGIISTIAGTDSAGFSGDNGPAIFAKLRRPSGIIIDKAGNIIFADAYNHRIRKISTNGIISTIAGSGPSTWDPGGFGGDSGLATSARLRYPTDIALDKNGNLLIADMDNNRIRIVDNAGIIKTFAGTGTPASGGDNGPAAQCNLFRPGSICIDTAGNIYVTEKYGYKIRKITNDGIIRTYAGTGISNYGGDNGSALLASFRMPNGIRLDQSGNMLVADEYRRIRKVTYACGNPIGSIIGTNSAFPGSVQNYSVPGDSSAIRYEWTVPSGATIINGANTKNITVNFGSNQGNVTVTPVFACGNGYQSSLFISIDTTLHLIAGSQNICPVSGTNLPASLDIPVRVRGFYDLVSLQGSIRWDSSVITFNSITSVAPGIGLSVSNFNSTAANRLLFSWFDNDLTGKRLTDSANLFVIRFNIKSNSFNKSSAIQFTDTTLTVEAFRYPANNIPITRKSGTINISRAPVNSTINIDSCNRVTFKGVEYFNSTTINDTLKTRLGCDSIYRTINITVNSNIALTGIAYNNPVKLGDTLKLTATGSNLQNANLNWKGPNGFISTSLAPVIPNITSLNRGLYTLVTNSNCRTDSQTIQVIIYSQIEGRIRNPNGAFLKNVSLTAKSNSYAVSDSFKILINTRDTTILSASKSNDINKSNGVSTLDIILIQSHLLQTALLNSPYKIIAADANNSGSVSTADILYLKRLILGIDTVFPGNRLWAFVDSSYNFPNLQNPFPYKSTFTYFPNSPNKNKETFIAVKIGDVNFDWNAALPKTQGDSSHTIEFYYKNVFAEENNIIRIPLRARGFKEMKGVQFTLNYNSQAMKLKTVDRNLLNAQYSLHASENGRIPFIWTDPDNIARSLPDDSIIMELIFQPLQKIQEEDISISSDITVNEGWDSQFNKYLITKTTGKIKGRKQSNENPSLTGWSISPNPSNGKIKLRYMIEANLISSIELRDLKGNLILNEKYRFSKDAGMIDLDLNKKGSLQPGIYLVRIPGIQHDKTEKLVIIR